jgi:hypothetical protein
MNTPRVHPTPGRRVVRRGHRQPDPGSPKPKPEVLESGPEDRALYGCSCGLVFDAPVSAGVECPRCGERQAW